MLVDYFYIGKELIDLTFSEWLILELLLLNKGRVVKYNEFESIVLCEKGAIVQHIGRLRKKLKNEFKINTKKGVGYYI